MQTIKPKRTLAEETYERLVDAICDGTLMAGERLNQDEIAARLNVSRQPVNSAISILRTNGLVEDTGRRSVVVKAFDPALFQAIYDYRCVIEPFAVRLAGQNVTVKERAQAQKIIDLGNRAIRRCDRATLIRADMQFHEVIYAWSGNPVIEMSMKNIWHHIRRSMAEVLKEPGAMQPVWNDHEAILEALFTGRTEEAACLMEAHIRTAYRCINLSMDTPPDRPKS